MRNTFQKKERLCSTKIITDLIEKGNVFHTRHFRVNWAESPVRIPFPAQVAISVSKKVFKSAVMRNLIKRRFREVYRKNKQILYSCLISEDRQISFIVVFRGKEVPDYRTMEESVSEVIDQLMIRVKHNNSKC